MGTEQSEDRGSRVSALLSCNGIETTRPVLSLSSVPESKVTKRHLAALRTREAADIRAHEQLVSAEENLRQAIVRYLKRGGTDHLAIEMVRNVVKYWAG